MRTPIVEEQFYPSNPDALSEKVKNLFYFSKVPFINGRIVGLIVPDSEIAYSGKASAKAYKSLQDNIVTTGEPVSTFIVLGINHSGLGSKISLSIQDFDTPLGVAGNDLTFVESIVASGLDAGLDISISESAHRNDYSVEVQLPFIKSVSPDAKIVPVLLKELSYAELMKFSEIIYDAVKNINSRIIIVSSSSVYHKNFSIVPFSTLAINDISREFISIDKFVFDDVISLDTKGFFLRAYNSGIIGGSCIASCLESCKLLGVSLVEVLEVANSLNSGSNDKNDIKGFVSALLIR